MARSFGSDLYASASSRQQSTPSSRSCAGVTGLLGSCLPPQVPCLISSLQQELLYSCEARSVSLAEQLRGHRHVALLPDQGWNTVWSSGELAASPLLVELVKARLARAFALQLPVKEKGSEPAEAAKLLQAHSEPRHA